MAAATLDRLPHHSHVINIRGENYRLKGKRQAGLLVSQALVDPLMGGWSEGPRSSRKYTWLVEGRVNSKLLLT